MKRVGDVIKFPEDAPGRKEVENCILVLKSLSRITGAYVYQVRYWTKESVRGLRWVEFGTYDNEDDAWKAAQMLYDTGMCSR